MLERKTNWRNRIALSVLILLSITVLTIHFREREQGFFHNFQRWSMNLLVPLESGVFTLVRSVSSGFKVVTEVGRLREENRELKKEIAKLRRESVLLSELEIENKRLRRELGSPVYRDFNTVYSSVIGKSVNNWQATVVLNKGSDDGIQKNMPVATADGLVGQVISTTRNACLAQLIIDRKSAVACRIQDSRATAIIEGQGGRELRLNFLPRETKVAKGEVILTSGLGGVYPPGIVIGTVALVGKGTYGLYKDVRVSPAVDFSTLEEVFIITGRR